MDKLESAQIRLLLQHLSSETIASCANDQKVMHADQAAKRMIRNGATIKRATEICEESGRYFIAMAVEKVGKVIMNGDAFDMIVGSFTAMTNSWDGHVAEAARLATMGAPDRLASADKAGRQMLADLKMRLFRELEIERFAFVRTPSPQTPGPVAPTATLATPPKNKGGKPLAAHWDEMWAFIAVQLYVGDLKPTSQKQIKKAMFDWFNARSIDVGDTAVNDRARQLWQKIEAEQ